MRRRAHLIIPIFVPFGGCPERCVFCNQQSITGRAEGPSIKEVTDTIERYLATWTRGGRKEVAFYGGSFTGLPAGIQEGYLMAASRFVREGLIDGLRVSTRPDYIDPERVGFLKEHGVDTVELGAQSMSERVLRLSGRGHGPEDTARAVGWLKEAGITTGVQLMPGLPGDTAATAVASAKRVASLGPDFVRIYPTLVVRDTPLYESFKRGEYTPWELDDMVSLCRRISLVFKEAGIKVIRMGLQPTEELREAFVAGPFHPSFRDLVEREDEAYLAGVRESLEDYKAGRVKKGSAEELIKELGLDR